MPQGLLPFHYEQERNPSGMTAFAGLALYLDLACLAGYWKSIERHVRVRTNDKGWSDAQMVMALTLLNLAGGTCVRDVDVLDKDPGFGELLRKAEGRMLSRKKRRALQRRRKKEQRKAARSMPSQSAVFRYLAAFHDPEHEELRQPHTAFIPEPNEHLRGLYRVNEDILAFMQRHSPEPLATLDVDATLVESHKRDALFCYKRFKGYQPLNVYWHEQSAVVHSQFRDGNVPAGYRNKAVLAEALDMLPDRVDKVRLRTDTAGYEVKLLKYCAEGRHERFGVIDFAIGVDVTSELKKAVAEVSDDDWKPLIRRQDGVDTDTGQECAERAPPLEIADQREASSRRTLLRSVRSAGCQWAGRSKNGPTYRFIAIREPLQQRELPGMETEQQLPFPTMELKGKGRYKVFGVVTNRDLPTEELVWWHRGRCGKSEEVHAVMKDDLAGGQLPSGDFGENAAWWAIRPPIGQPTGLSSRFSPSFGRR